MAVSINGKDVYIMQNAPIEVLEPSLSFVLVVMVSPARRRRCRL